MNGVDWAGLRCAYGPADPVPGFLRAAASPDPADQDNGVRELWQNVWHQGTVYSCTPHAVPFIAELVADDRLTDSTRAQLALLLASIASADSFVVEGESRPFVSAALRTPGDPTPSDPLSGVELDQDCRRAVVNASSVLDHAFCSAPDIVRAALLAAAATIASSLTQTAREAIVNQASAADPLIAHAAELVLALVVDQPLSQADLEAHAAVDDDAVDYLVQISDWPIRVRAVEGVRELSERAVSARLS